MMGFFYVFVFFPDDVLNMRQILLHLMNESNYAKNGLLGRVGMIGCMSCRRHPTTLRPVTLQNNPSNHITVMIP